MKGLSFSKDKAVTTIAKESEPATSSSDAHPEVRELQRCLYGVTERAGFEPAVPLKGTPVFETGSINHSDTSPGTYIKRSYASLFLLSPVH